MNESRGKESPARWWTSSPLSLFRPRVRRRTLLTELGASSVEARGTARAASTGEAGVREVEGGAYQRARKWMDQSQVSCKRVTT